MNVKRALFILLMLVLPWQTRWFSDAGLLAGYPWEQGRISIYAFWLILLVCATVSLWQKRVQWRKPQVIELILLVAVLVPALFSGEPRASIAWLISVAFAGVFVWVIQREQIRLTDLALWFSISLIPHALLGMFQFAVQFGFDQKWLGLSALDPATKGTAVILNEGVRYLRAYGGFPHPNIFGGYLALALLGMAYFWSTFSDLGQKALGLLFTPISDGACVNSISFGVACVCLWSSCFYCSSKEVQGRSASLVGNLFTVRFNARDFSFSRPSCLRTKSRSS
jgi:hypothetical protein